MIEFCEKATVYTRDMDVDEFVADPIRYEATLWNVGLIGDAATRVPDEIRDSFANIELAEIIGIRNRLIHGYFRARNAIVWETIRTDIPQLLADLRELMKQVDEGNA